MLFNKSNPFQSFWMGGYECTDQLNSSGNRVDLLSMTGHLTRLKQDYEDLKLFNITTVREGIRWSHVEKQPYQYDFATVRLMMQQGRASGIQQVWDICHFGFPDDLSPLHPHFTRRFVSLCSAFATFQKTEFPNDTFIVTPINEVSFLSWLGGEAAGTSPYTTDNGWNVKYALMRAYIQGIYVMKAINPAIRIMTTEPIVNMVPPLNATEEEIIHAAKLNEDQFQAVDILAGYICPELGGSPELLDLLGYNFYYNNQWVTDFNEFLPWFNNNNDPRWRPLSDLLADAHKRYNKPLVLSETSHPGEDRGNWITFISEQCSKAITMGLPLYGVCLYPIIDRPDWDNVSHWHHSGLWDNLSLPNTPEERTLFLPYAEALKNAQRLIAQAIPASDLLTISR